VKEGALADLLSLARDRGVEMLPVDREAEGAEQVLERLLVLVGEQMAQFDEVAP
jgi:hypothetical protein